MNAKDYMSRPCSMLGESLEWAVLGASNDGQSAGVLAWCWDEDDARAALKAIRATGEWRGLTIEHLRQEES